MKKALIVIGVCAGCGTGDDLGAPRLVERASNLVPVTKLAFDADNRPLGLLDADHRRRLARLTADGWVPIESTENYNVLDFTAADDGTVLAAVGNLSPGSGVFRFMPDDQVVQQGNRLTTTVLIDPYQSPSGDLYVSSADGGRRLSHGAQDWGIAKALAQVVHTDDAIYGLSSTGLERLVGVLADDDTTTVMLPCSALPVACSVIHFDGRDGAGRTFFHADDAPELWILDDGASELFPLAIPGTQALGSVLATPRFVVVEVIVETEDRRDSVLYILPSGGDTFTLVDTRAHTALERPVLAVDHDGTVFAAHADWLGTIELE